MDLFNLDPATIFSFFLTLMRVSLILFLMPFFGGSVLPNPIKAALCLVLSLAIWPRLSFPGAIMPASPWMIALMLFGEVIMGLLLDVIVRFLFAAVQTAGHYVGFAMGFAIMNVVDPLSGAQEPITGHVLYQTTMLIFLSLNGHLFLLQGLADSFHLVPPGGLLINPELGEHLLAFSGNIFVLAAKIAAPVIASLFLVDLALALISRAAPQMNVLFIGFPLKIGVGFVFMTLVLTALARYVGEYIIEMDAIFRAVLKGVS
ncbi:flagellar biosynthetic protein FliR [Desulfolutivibrio sulfoxidireducens]|uniref:flagellar biosynthetic protein FliR n=1 Tax=Desulfolutivibrio sulfoxidireducens TaxID=2773299 RepID=UPI00159D58E7|nr:flagellar biosynthetic protein FliR [Desulfolutivibrio sulfoxidireducens]QLA16409.1 flagellar biosynthetic protein FliR [Desulfolutivibrio sulfoxidireducens]QLA19710.1 flagellar biosynthetic protein FliR [Desulfolutivibrio sulfoxidireducens]